MTTCPTNNHTSETEEHNIIIQYAFKIAPKQMKTPKYYQIEIDEKV